MKLHLPARAPSEGSRLLAQWIMVLPTGLDGASEMLGTGAEYVQRMVSGEAVPGLILGQRMRRFFAIRAREFDSPPLGGWFDGSANLPKAA